MSQMMKEAERGDLDAQHQVGACFATGDWDGPKDEVEAVKWYTKAAEAGHALSQYDLGFMLLFGEGTEKDTQRGLWWMEQAVKNGQENAAAVLTDIYKGGLFGVEPNPEHAARWNEKAGRFKRMSRRATVFTSTALTWLLVTGAYAAFYVIARSNLSGAEGYETQWDWQLMFFSLTRLPYFVAAFAVVIFIEAKLLRRSGTDG